MHAAKLSACVAFLPEINPSLGSHELPELQILDFPCKKMNLRARRAYRVPRFNTNNSEQTGVLDGRRTETWTSLLHDFELKVEFLAPHYRREIELPKLPREPKRRP